MTVCILTSLMLPCSYMDVNKYETVFEINVYLTSWTLPPSSVQKRKNVLLIRECADRCLCCLLSRPAVSFKCCSERCRVIIDNTWRSHLWHVSSVHINHFSPSAFLHPLAASSCNFSIKTWMSYFSCRVCCSH